MERNVEKEDGKDEVLKEREEERMMRLRVGRGGGREVDGSGCGKRLETSAFNRRGNVFGGGDPGQASLLFLFFFKLFPICPHY